MDGWIRRPPVYSRTWRRFKSKPGRFNWVQEKNYQRQPSSRENIQSFANKNVILWYGLEYICEFVKLLVRKNRVLSMSKNIWRCKDTVIFSFSWKTTWCSQIKGPWTRLRKTQCCSQESIPNCRLVMTKESSPMIMVHIGNTSSLRWEGGW